MSTPSPAKATAKEKAKPAFEFTADEVKLRYIQPVTGNVLSVTTESVASQYYCNGVIETGILPPVVRYVSNDNLSCLIERPPHRATIEYKDGPSYDKKSEVKLYNIAMPWTVFGVTLSKKLMIYSVFIWYRNDQIWSPADKLYSPVLPNVYPEGGICISESNSGAIYKTRHKDLASAVSLAISTFWGSTFNRDLSGFHDTCLPEYVRNKIKDNDPYKSVDALDVMNALEALTSDEALEIQYVDSGYTVGSIIKRMENNSSHYRKGVSSLSSFFTPMFNAAEGI